MIYFCENLMIASYCLQDGTITQKTDNRNFAAECQGEAVSFMLSLWPRLSLSTPVCSLSKENV